uniref:Uncharacterized protein n=1 Tax=Myoviridae sp. ctagO6 TaxID=2826667 RepID=A0A8S5NPY9_9CAUD|nr:MAG TPA: hypothetical protein [Myoviridae sp. ctagO6]
MMQISMIFLPSVSFIMFTPLFVWDPLLYGPIVHKSLRKVNSKLEFAQSKNRQKLTHDFRQF